MLPLTGKQLKALEAIQTFAKREGRMPSVRELARILDLSCSTTHQHLRALEKKGMLSTDGTAHGIALQLKGARTSGDARRGRPLPGAGRTLPGAGRTLPGAGRTLPGAGVTINEALVEVPLIGTIAAGAPIEALEIVDDPLYLSASLAPEGSYALRVRGDSMVDDHILDGDLIVVKPQERVEQGQIAVALLDDGTATLKRIYRERGRVRLQPANERLEPFFADNVTIQGKVVAVLRVPS